MPELKDVTGWTIGGHDLVKLLDCKCRSVFEFSEVESGMFDAQRPGEGIFFMQNAAAATSTRRAFRSTRWRAIGAWCAAPVRRCVPSR